MSGGRLAGSIRPSCKHTPSVSSSPQNSAIRTFEPVDLDAGLQQSAPRRTMGALHLEAQDHPVVNGEKLLDRERCVDQVWVTYHRLHVVNGAIDRLPSRTVHSDPLTEDVIQTIEIAVLPSV